MGRNGTAGTRQLVVDMDVGLRTRLDERVSAEERTLRRVVERAIAFYMDHVPVEQLPTLPAALQPQRGRPRGKGK
jgi:hypothetical protein